MFLFTDRARSRSQSSSIINSSVKKKKTINTYPEHWQFTSQCLLLSPHILSQNITSTVSQIVHNSISLSEKFFITVFLGAHQSLCPLASGAKRRLTSEMGEFPRARETTVGDTTLYVFYGRVPGFLLLW